MDQNHCEVPPNPRFDSIRIRQNFIFAQKWLFCLIFVVPGFNRFEPDSETNLFFCLEPMKRFETFDLPKLEVPLRTSFRKIITVL